MDEIHQAPYSGHPGYQKTIATARKQYFWPGMKKDLTEYISRCMKCQKVKVEHQHPAGLLQPLLVPEWKWEVISMDFITGLPMTWRQHDSIMVVVDKLTKAAHFILVKSMHKTDDIAKIFMKDISSCMDCLRQLSLTEMSSSLPIFGRGCLQIWVPS